MAYPQTNDMMRAMSDDMQRKLGGYYGTMHTRYGNPRVQREQENEQRRAYAAAMHAKAQHTSELLKGAYDEQQAKNRTEHSARLASKSRAPKTSTRPSKAAKAPAPRQTPAPAFEAAPAPSPDPASEP